MEHRVTTLEVEVQHLRKSQDAILAELKAINTELSRYRGAWGAVVMIGVALATAVTIGIKYFGK